MRIIIEKKVDETQFFSFKNSLKIGNGYFTFSQSQILFMPKYATECKYYITVRFKKNYHSSWR